MFRSNVSFSSVQRMAAISLRSLPGTTRLALSHSPSSSRKMGGTACSNASSSVKASRGICNIRAASSGSRSYPRASARSAFLMPLLARTVLMAQPTVSLIWSFCFVMVGLLLIVSVMIT